MCFLKRIGMPAPRLGLMGPLALVAAACCLGSVPAAHAEDCRADWTLMEGKSVPLYPDLNAAYIVYRFVNDPEIALRIQGQFPHARFQSITVYEDEGGSLVGKLADIEIMPDEGSTNPFLPGEARDAEARDYTFWVTPEGSAAAENDNVIETAPAAPYLTLIVRVYAPDDGTDSMGGAGYPRLEAVDATSLNPVACPLTHENSAAGQGDEQSGPELTSEVSFYRLLGSTAYPSYDTAYLGAPLDRSLGDVAVFRFRAPTFTDTHSGGGSFSGEEEVRYWSVCLSRLKVTTTVDCLADYQVSAVDGWVRFAVGPGTPANRRMAATNDVGFLNWKSSVLLPAILYRNMVIHPDFAYGADQVPPYDDSIPADEQKAQNFIGEYAPTGVQCTSEQFQSTLCGLSQP